jgi:DNA-3-methyladenine glycosylase
VKLPRKFYTRPNVVQIAKDLLGKVLYTKLNGKITAGIITETEAYAGVVDRASHAYGGRRTARTEIMFGQGGTAFVYLCYGIHHLFNVVTNQEGVPHAVLIRAVKPIVGIPTILTRRKKYKEDDRLCGGPGTVSQGLGIVTAHSGESLLGNKIWIEDKGIRISKVDIIKSPRIGVDYAGADALLPYRFVVKL